MRMSMELLFESLVLSLGIYFIDRVYLQNRRVYHNLLDNTI